MREHYDVGVAGFWFGANYGSLLNGYAIYRTIKSFGKSVLMIHKPGDPTGDPELTQGHNVDFVRKYYDPKDVSPHYPYDRLHELNDRCDAFCAGSDQVWNYPISFDENMYLPFAEEGKRLLSFASSFGTADGNIPAEASERIGSYLRRFSAISVREKFAERFLADRYGISAETIIEPVFLLDEETIDQMISASRFRPRDPYLLLYILDPTEKKREAIKRYVKALKMRAVTLLDGKHYLPDNDKRNIEMHDFAVPLGQAGCEEFLRAFHDAAFVITDSFHGTAFSLLFHKSFLSIGNPIRGRERFLDLLGRLGRTDRLIEDPDEIPFDRRFLAPINYDETDRRIRQERAHAMAWLRRAFDAPLS